MLIGHQRIWHYLTESVRYHRLAHAYLFVGPPQVGKMTCAVEFIKWLFCEKKGIGTKACQQCPACLKIDRREHPDVLILSVGQTEKKETVKKSELDIDSIRALQHQFSLHPYSSPYKVAIIEEAADLSAEAANAFLKTLEEPSAHSLLILISSCQSMVLPTIISRCQIIKFFSVTEKEMMSELRNSVKAPADLIKIIKLAAGRPGRAMALISEPKLLVQYENDYQNFKKFLSADLPDRFAMAAELSKNTFIAQETLSQWLLWLRDWILIASGLADGANESRSAKDRDSLADLINFCREIQQTQIILNNSSFNARLALEVLMTKI